MLAVHQNPAHYAQALNMRGKKALSKARCLSRIKLNPRAGTMRDGAIRSVEAGKAEQLRCEQSQGRKARRRAAEHPGKAEAAQVR
jgi:hypothetical protein